MNNPQVIFNKKHNDSHKGFTLIELISGLALTLIVSTLALQGLSNSQRGFAQDRDGIESGQKLSSVLDIISRDVRQAGEDINENSFPVIKIIPDSSTQGAKLIVYRALMEPLPICNASGSVLGIPTGTVVSSIVTSSSDTNFTDLYSSCQSDGAPDPPQAYPLKQKVPAGVLSENWEARRLAAGGTLPGVLYNGSGSLQPFVYTGNSKGTQIYNSVNANITSITTLPFTTSQNFSLNSTAYLIEKREYLVCSSTNTLKVLINSPDSTYTQCSSPDSSTYQTIATNIEKMDIISSIRTPVAGAEDTVSVLPANEAFPSTTPVRTWQNIQGLTVRLRAKDPEGRSFASLNSAQKAKLIVEGKFYPRNILSAKRKGS